MSIKYLQEQGIQIKINSVIMRSNIEDVIILAKKAKQFGFSILIDKNKMFTFIGDEVCSNLTEKYVKNSNWLFADAYMAGEDAEQYNPDDLEKIELLCERKIKL